MCTDSLVYCRNSMPGRTRIIRLWHYVAAAAGGQFASAIVLFAAVAEFAVATTVAFVVSSCEHVVAFAAGDAPVAAALSVDVAPH